MYWKGKYVFSAMCACVCAPVPSPHSSEQDEQERRPKAVERAGWEDAIALMVSIWCACTILIFMYIVFVYNFVCVYRQGVRPCCQSCLLTRLSARTPAQPVWRSRMWKSKCPPHPIPLSWALALSPSLSSCPSHCWFEHQMHTDELLCLSRLPLSKGHFPRLAECAHFHYENVDFGSVQVREIWLFFFF